MAWTTRIVKIDNETGEILNDDQIKRRNLEIVEAERILNKVTPTHNETIIIKKYGPAKQQRLEFE